MAKCVICNGCVYREPDSVKRIDGKLYSFYWCKFCRRRQIYNIEKREWVSEPSRANQQGL